jgi:peroxiredoxin
MKKLVVLFLSVLFLASCGGKKGEKFRISGSVKGADTGLVYLLRLGDGDMVVADSAILKKGEFTFEGKVPVPERWLISIRGMQFQFPFFIENSDIRLTLHADSTEKVEVTGSATQDVYNLFSAREDSINNKMAELDKQAEAAQKSGDTVMMKKLDSLYNGIDDGMKKLIVDFAKSNGKSIVAPYLVSRNFYRFEYPELKDIAAAFDSSLAKSVYFQTVTTRVEVLRKVQIGMPAIDFTMNDTTGKPVMLSSLKGKYLLVDFWASWCRPCRAENPNVVKAYNGYNRKGFDVIGVSLDKNRDKWVKAIKADNLTWTHVSDLAGWGNNVARTYGVSSIPSNILLDKDQKIIARNLRGEDLEKKLAEILGPPEKHPAKKPAVKKK